MIAGRKGGHAAVGRMSAATSITVRVRLAVRHRPGRRTIVPPMTDGVAPVTIRADPTLVKALARAFRYQRLLDGGRYAFTGELAAAERIERSYLGGLLRLTLLAPASPGADSPGAGHRVGGPRRVAAGRPCLRHSGGRYAGWLGEPTGMISARAAPEQNPPRGLIAPDRAGAAKP